MSTLRLRAVLEEHHQDPRLVGRQVVEDPVEGGVPVVGGPDVARLLEQLLAALAERGRPDLGHLAADDAAVVARQGQGRRTGDDAAELLTCLEESGADGHAVGDVAGDVAHRPDDRTDLADQLDGLVAVGGGAADAPPVARGRPQRPAASC